MRSGPPQNTWGRFDIEGYASLYGATHRRGAFIEALAPLKPAAIDFSQYLTDVGRGDNPLDREWRELGHMAPGNIPAQWRLARSIASLSVPVNGWYVDVSASETIGVLRREVHQWRNPIHLGDPPLDMSDIAGGNRVG